MEEAQKRAKLYWRHKNAFRFLDIILLLLFLALIQLTDISIRIRNFSFSLSDNFYIALWIYLIFLSSGWYLLISPLNFYEGFVLEHSFSLSNLTLAAWIKDEIKKGILSFLIFSILIETLYAIARNFGNTWWLVASLAWITYSIIFTRIFPVVVIPLFYKYKPLTSSELRDKIFKLAKALNIKILDAFEIELSSKTKKSNAAIVGWGGTRRIILADNLIREFTVGETEVVVAHEMAHYKLKHIWKLLAVSALSAGLSFYLFALIGGKAASSLGAAGPFDISIFPMIWLSFSLYAFLIMPLQNGISRKLERDADTLALKTTLSKDSFISLMEKLAEKNLSDKYPNRLIEILFYDHPPIAKRVESAKAIFV